MKYTVWKTYFDYEKEEKWLNEMSAKGMALVGYSPFRYVFEDCEPGEYSYKIQLLDNHPTSPEGIKYIKFLEDTGVEHVASHIRWVFLRKKTSEGNFKLFTDTKSKINHHYRIVTLWTPLCFLNLSIGIPNLIKGFSENSTFFKVGPLLNIVVSIVLVVHIVRQLAKVKKLKKDKILFDS